MHTFIRKEIKKDTKLSRLSAIIVKGHHIPEYTRKTLINNKDVKDFCEQSRHFSILKRDHTDLYIHYDVSSWFKAPMGVQIIIDSITVYQDYLEYEIARQKALVNTPNSHNPNQN